MSQFNQSKLDASESVFFARELEEIRAKTYDIKYENLKALSFVPVDATVDNAVDVITYRQYDSVGVAKWITSYAKDFPRADVKGAEFSTKVRSFGTSYAYDIQEIRKAKRENKSLEQRKANAARKAIEQFHEDVCKLGDGTAAGTLLGIRGFLNIPNALTVTIPADGTGSSALWSAKTPDLIVRDMHLMANYMVETTKDIEHPDTLLMPLTAFHTVTTTRMGAGDGAMSILQCFLANSQYIKTVAPWTQLQTAGASSGRRMVAYRRDPDVLQYIAPVMMEQFPAQEEMMEFVTPVHARSGGVVCYYPLAVAYGDGF